MTRAPGWSVHPDLVAFYRSNRNRPEHLYRSEARYLPWLAERSESVLDVGCAAGGFRSIWQAYAPAIRYEGVDLSAKLVEAARVLHPDVPFHQGDAVAGIELPDGRADVVQALGWLHWCEEWERALDELWRLAGRYLFFDARLALDGEGVVGRQRLELAGAWDGRTTTPYVVVPWPRLVRRIGSLAPAAVHGFGYRGAPAPSVEGVPDEICFATFVLERGEPVAEPRLELELPLEWRDAWLSRSA
ncbi:MAG TPA: class I SAM-dependent methyltransferase [Gaiellaceae bacterium]|nr:class I SAM-dependent methyltransferase [Gaiellaceae bacterium]